MSLKYHKHFCEWLTASGQRNHYSNYICLFLKFCEKNNIEYKDITFEYMNTYINELREKKLEEGTINNYLKSVRSFYSFLVKSKIVDNTVLEDIKEIKLLKVTEKDRTYITEEELKDIVDMGSSFCNINPFKLKALLYFMFYSGVRKAELTNLKREDINLVERYAIIRAPVKNKRERKVPFTKKVVRILKDYYSTEPEIKTAFNTSYRQLEKIFKQLRGFAPNNKKLTPHILRTSFFYDLAKKGFNLREMQKLGGHSSIESTKKYYNPTEEEVLSTYKERMEKK